MTDEIREGKQEKWPGHRLGMQSIWFGIGAVAAGLIPIAGLVIGKIAMDRGEKSRRESPQTKRWLGLLGVLLGGFGFFMNLLVIASIITVAFLLGTNIMELGAM